VTALVELLLSVIDLLKVQIDRAKLSVFDLIAALVLIQSAALLVLGGLGLLLAGLFVTLLKGMHVMLAALITAGIMFLFAGLAFWMGAQKGKTHGRR
jgi:hypothetical protein